MKIIVLLETQKTGALYDLTLKLTNFLMLFSRILGLTHVTCKFHRIVTKIGLCNFFLDFQIHAYGDKPSKFFFYYESHLVVLHNYP